MHPCRPQPAGQADAPPSPPTPLSGGGSPGSGSVELVLELEEDELDEDELDEDELEDDELEDDVDVVVVVVDVVVVVVDVVVDDDEVVELVAVVDVVGSKAGDGLLRAGPAGSRAVPATPEPLRWASASSPTPPEVEAGSVVIDANEEAVPGRASS